MEWLGANWAVIVLVVSAVLAVATVLDNVTEHYTKFGGFQRWFLFAVRLLSLVKQVDPKRFPMRKAPDGKTVPKNE